MTVRPREQTVGDRVTVEQALEAAETAEDCYALDRPVVTLARFVLQEHGGDRDGEGGLFSREMLALAVDPTLPRNTFEFRHPDGRVDRFTVPPSEPPRPELPPARKGWVLTGEWGDPWENGWEWFAGGGVGWPCRSDSALRPRDDQQVEPPPYGRGTFRFRLLKVPAPPEEGWVVTKYEEPQKGDLYSSVEGRWCRKVNPWRFLGCGPYPDGRRFIAEQDDTGDDRTRLAKALATLDGWYGDPAPYYTEHADRLLALGVKAPDPVRLESL